MLFLKWGITRADNLGDNRKLVGSYPEYAPDPEDEKMKTARAERASARSKILGPVFRPSGTSKST